MRTSASSVEPRLRYGALAGVVAAALVAGCDWTVDTRVSPPVGEGLKAVEPVSNLRSFGSERKLKAYLKEQFSDIQPVDYGWYWWGGEISIALPVFFALNAVDDGAVAMDASFASAAPAGGESAGEGYSTTNIQEQGVDESDVVKTDGTHFYVAVGSEVRIVRAVPADGMEVLGSIPAGGPVDSLYLYGDLMVVLYRLASYYYPYYDVALGAPVYDYQGSSIAPSIEGIPEDRPYAKTGVLLVDVTDPAGPAALREFLFEGSLEASRLTGGRLHLVQRFTPSVPGLRYWYDGTQEDLAAVEAENRAVMEALTLDDLIPAYYELDGAGAVAEAGRAVGARDFSRPADPEGRGIVTVVTIDLEDLSSGFRSSAAVADVDTVYASTQALYLAHAIMSHTEDPQPPPLAGYDYGKQTVVRKFDLTADRVRNVASGRVWGHPLNQFSLGEHEDVLRIATTTGFTWATGERTSRNHVFCLAEGGGAHLEVIGSVENMAPGERIYAARFLGERGFLVTFRQVDPLFTLDLSDPANPRVVGELKVPGYSAYIHPLGPGHLLTIGKDPSRVCLSVFDVTDFANPTLLHKEIMSDGWSDSEALRNHKAFTFWAERDLLAIPVHYSRYVEVDGVWQYDGFTGLCVYRVTVAGGFERLGRIDTVPEGSTYYWSGWTRGVFIGEDVYAVTPEAVRAAAVDGIGGAVWSAGLAQQ